MEKTTEQTILEAARDVFVKRGYDGARMQEIADEAGINKALLHYYFRSKDQLFDAVFRNVLADFLPSISLIIADDAPILKKIELLVDTYLSALQRNPYIPSFIIHELNVNPQKFVDKVTNFGINPQKLVQQVEAEVKNGSIYPVIPEHLLVNVISMCIFPFVAKPILQRLLVMGDAEYRHFMEQRKSQIMTSITKTLQP